MTVSAVAMWPCFSLALFFSLSPSHLLPSYPESQFFLLSCPFGSNTRTLITGFSGPPRSDHDRQWDKDMARWLLLYWCILLVYTLSVLVCSRPLMLAEWLRTDPSKFLLVGPSEARKIDVTHLKEIDTCRDKSRKKTQKSCRTFLLGHDACRAELAGEETEMLFDP